MDNFYNTPFSTGYVAPNAYQTGMQGGQCMYNPYSNDPYSMGQQAQFKVPAASSQNIQQFIIMDIARGTGVDFNLLSQLIEFIKLTEPISQEAIPHACKFNLLALDKIQTYRLQFYDKATIEYAYCKKCFKVIYYVEKY